jgi:solute:Na+ symporter, SSS family
MQFFNAADWFVIILYLAAMVGLGVWFGKDQKNTRDYFLGSKNTPWWGIGLSIVATETSALTIISVPATAYGGNISFIQIIIGYVIARIILAIVMVPHYFKGEIYSPYQLLETSFGQGARKLAGGIFLISETLGAGVRVYVASIPLNLMLGEKVLSFGTGQPILGSIFIFVIVSLVYTYIGGVKAVIWTDAVQFFLFLGGGLFTLFYLPTLIDGGFSGAMEVAHRNWKLEWFNGEFSLAMPYNIWMGIIGATFVVMSSHGAEQLIVQRVLACGSVKDGRKALVLSAVLIFPMFLMFLMIGVLLWVFYQTHPMGVPIPEVKAGTGIKANDYIYPIFMITEVPHVLKGFLIVAILAAAMSSVSSTLNALASVSTMDFVKAMTRGERTEDFYLRFSKWSTVFWAGALIVVAYLSRGVPYVLNTAFTLKGLTSGALLGALALVLFWKHGRAIPVMIGMAGSFIGMIFINQFEWTISQAPVLQTTKIAWPWYTLIGTIMCIGIAWIARAIMGKPAPAK